MIGHFRPAKRIGRIGVLAVLAMSSQGCAKGMNVAHPLTKIDQLIAGVRDGRPIDRGTVQGALSVTLPLISENPAFRTYRNDQVRLDALSASVELREPVAGGTATAGSLLIIKILDGCPRKSDIEARFAPWTVTNTPRGQSLNEETNWSRKEPWGKLSFGFAERAPDCLSSITFSALDPA